MAETNAELLALRTDKNKDVEVVYKSTEKKYFQIEKCRAIFVIFLIIFLIILVGVLVTLLAVTARKNQKEAFEPTKTENITGKKEELKPGPEPYWSYRLPGNTTPEHYDLTINVDVDNRSFSGSVKILINVKQSTEWLLVHSNRLKISSPVLRKDKTGTKPEAISKNFDFKRRSYYVIRTRSSIVPGKYILSMKFTGTIERMETGLFWEEFETKNGTKQPYASTQFEPFSARKMFPCFDEPAMKATFSTTIIHAAKYIAVSNMPVAESKLRSDGLVEDQFKKSVVMPTYLVALAVGEFKYKEKMIEKRQLPIRAYCHEEILDQADYALDVATSTVSYFEKLFDMQYSLPKLDLILLPKFKIGGMENWGLITMSERYFLYNPDDSTDRQKVRIAAIVIHEVGHQWFGNIVTMKWWDDLWLNEGFASFSSYLGIDHYHPEQEPFKRFLLQDQYPAMAADGEITSYPLINPVTNKVRFGTVTYKKGSCILRIMQGFLGNDIFNSGIITYLKRHEYGSVTSDDLWSALQQSVNASGIMQLDVKEIMDTWTKQMNFPVVNVKVDAGSQKVQLSQERFLSDPDVNISDAKFVSPYGYKWIIPFSYSLGNKKATSPVTGEDKTVFMDLDKLVEIPISEGKWIKGNWNQYGFYFVNYDEKTWRDLSEQLLLYHKAFSPEDRGGMLRDASSLARVDRLSYEVFMEMTRYVSKEDEYVPLYFILKTLMSFKRFIFHTSSFYQNLQQYILKQTSSKYQEIGFEEKSDDSYVIKVHQRSLIVDALCSCGYEPCLQDARRIFLNWKNYRIPIPPNIRQKAYFYGISEGTVDDWDFLFNYYSTKNPGQIERQQLLEGLAGSKELWVLTRYLHYSLDPLKIQKRDRNTVIGSVATINPIGRRAAWNFISFHKNNKTSGISRYIAGNVASGLNTEFEYNQVKDYFPAEKKSDKAYAKSILKRIRFNIRWREKYETLINNWLEKFLAN